ncbi:MAG: hypothetical protein AAF597_20360 [Bacteroidota bacterium]
MITSLISFAILLIFATYVLHLAGLRKAYKKHGGRMFYPFRYRK